MWKGRKSSRGSAAPRWGVKWQDIGGGGGRAGEPSDGAHRCGSGTREAHLRAYLGLSQNVHGKQLKTKPFNI